MILIGKAKQFAHEAHDSICQKRKYTEEPYWVHTDEVADIVSSVTDNEEIIAAAHLHDVLEDVVPNNSFYSAELINNEFNSSILNLVIELTDVFTHKDYPQFNRERRKQLEKERISKISTNAMTIKLADIISNTQSIVNHGKGFARIYMGEIKKILPMLQGGDSTLFQKTAKIIVDF